MHHTTTFRKVLLIGLLTFLITSQTGTVSAGINVWTSNGPKGGEILALAIDPQTPTTIYAGTNGGGVFKSTDGGGNWSAVNTGLTCPFVSTLAIDPTTPSTLYAGTWRGPIEGEGKGGVFKSTDGGASWKAVNNGLPSWGINVYALAIDPQNPSTIYVGTEAVMTYSQIIVGGAFKSTDGGGNWSEVITGLNSGNVCVLAIDPKTPSTLYAGTNGIGVFKSTNGGGGWSAVNSGLTSTDVRALVIDPATPSTLYEGAYGDGVFKSTDGGGNWSAVNTGLTITYINALAIDPQTPTTIYAGIGNGSSGSVFKSTNGGGNWSEFNNGLPNNASVYVLAIDPKNPTTLYAGQGGDVFAIQQIQVPALAINYSGGAPGSYFTITGSNFPPSSTATITVNGNVLGTVPTDASGGFIFLLETSLTAEEGFYRVTVSVNPSASTQFTLDAEDDVRPQEGSETVFVVPDGIAYHVVYLPLIVK